MTEHRALQEEIVRIATDEQRRIGQELHDSTQQELMGLGLLAENLVDALADPGLATQRELAAKIAAGISESGRHVRRLANGLVPVPVDADGLMAAIENLAERIGRDTGITCRFVCPAPVRVEDDIVALHVYRIVQEAVTNALKHSNATEISIHLKRSDDHFAIEVRDNGIGIDRQRISAEGLGLRIMEHRCELIGGTFTVRPRKPGGTLVRCRIPTVSGD